MNYFLSPHAVLKSLEHPSVYHIKNDELYELDHESFAFLEQCSSASGCSAVDTGFAEYCTKENILVTSPVRLSRPKPCKSPEPSLRYLELQITDRCNLRCRHCYLGDTPNNELPITLIQKILAEFEALQGLRVLITGGEPLLHTDFDQINSMLPEFFIRKILFTNGLLLNKPLLQQLNVHEIQVSIDGLEKAHDLLRGENTFRRSMDAIKLSLDCGFDVSVSTMVHAKNLADFEEMESTFKDLGIKEWTVDIPCAAGRFLYNSEFHVDLVVSGKYLGYGYGGGLHEGSAGFGCGLHLMAVMADGRCAKCTFYSHRPLGTADEGLLTCWEKNHPVRLADLTCNCEHIESCRGGCRYRAELLGNAAGKDYYRCSFYDIVKT